MHEMQAHEQRLSQCPICSSGRLAASFYVAFPQRAQDGRVAWPVSETPPVPAWAFDRCPACGVYFANPLPSPDALHSFYLRQREPNDWEMVHYVEATADRSAYWSGFAEKLTRLSGGVGRFLEVGPAAGHLLRAAREQGWDVVGVEAAPKFARLVRQQGIPVHEGVLATLDGGIEPFDVIAMFDVLEHLADPISDLVRCRRLLHEDGRLVVATCDIGSFAARYYGLGWRQLVISHTFYRTNTSLRIALERPGFDVIDTASVRWWDPDPWIERQKRVKEFGKLIARKALQKTWMPLVRRSSQVRDFQLLLTRGSLDLARLEHKVGDQAVMSEVVLMVARPSPRQYARA